MCLITGAIIIPLIINYWIIVILLPISFIFLSFRNYFIESGRQLKRLENVARSPIFVHTNNTIEGILFKFEQSLIFMIHSFKVNKLIIGITTIRSFGRQEILCQEFEMFNNNHTRTFYDSVCCSRWFGLRLDFLCAIFTILILFFCIFMKGLIFNISLFA